jgi:hypothetical protein
MNIAETAYLNQIREQLLLRRQNLETPSASTKPRRCITCCRR